MSIPPPLRGARIPLAVAAGAFAVLSGRPEAETGRANSRLTGFPLTGLHGAVYGGYGAAENHRSAQSLPFGNFQGANSSRSES